MKKQKPKPRLSQTTRQSMMRNAAGSHGDKRKEQSRKLARKKVSKSDW